MAGHPAGGQSHHTNFFLCHDDDLSGNSCDSGGSDSGIKSLDKNDRNDERFSSVTAGRTVFCLKPDCMDKRHISSAVKRHKIRS